MELDNGASVSVCSKGFYQNNFKTLKLLPSDLSLSSYTSEPIVPIGKVCVLVEYKTFKTKLDLYVIEKGAHPLMGCDWLQALGEILFKSKLFELNNNDETVYENYVKKLVQDFPEVFTEQLGEYKGEPIKLKLKENAKAEF